MNYGFDFTQFNKEGFLFTPESYNGEYESIGLLRTVVYPAVKHPEKQVKTKTGRIRYVEQGWEVESIEPTEALKEMYKKAVAMGANALVKFQIDNTSYLNGSLLVRGYEVSGFAIKRIHK